MATTIYASFRDVENAERAAGALLDYGVRPEDVSLVRQDGRIEHFETPKDSAAMVGSQGAVATSGITEEGHSAALQGDTISAQDDRFGTDALGVTEPIQATPSSDASGIAGEHEIKRGIGAQPESDYVPGSSRASDNEYDNLASRNKDDDEYSPETAAKSGLTATTPEDAGAGAIKGAGIGLGVGALAALVSIFVPGLGLIAGGGALATALGGLAGTTGAGAIAGAVTGYLKDQGMDSHLADQYGRSVDEGGALMSVSVPSANVDESTVRSILDKYGAGHVTNFAGTGSGGYVA